MKPLHRGYQCSMQRKSKPALQCGDVSSHMHDSMTRLLPAAPSLKRCQMKNQQNRYLQSTVPHGWQMPPSRSSPVLHIGARRLRRGHAAQSMALVALKAYRMHVLHWVRG